MKLHEYTTLKKEFALLTIIIFQNSCGKFYDILSKLRHFKCINDCKVKKNKLWWKKEIHRRSKNVKSYQNILSYLFTYIFDTQFWSKIDVNAVLAFLPKNSFANCRTLFVFFFASESTNILYLSMKLCKQVYFNTIWHPLCFFGYFSFIKIYF